MANQQQLRDLLEAKKVQLVLIDHNISLIVLQIRKLSLKFYKEDAKVQQKINKVQFSRPRGNPANQWPHTPMTNRVRAFYQVKERIDPYFYYTWLIPHTLHGKGEFYFVFAFPETLITFVETTLEIVWPDFYVGHISFFLSFFLVPLTFSFLFLSLDCGKTE